MVIDSWQLRRRWLRLKRPVALALIGFGALVLFTRLNAPEASTPTVVATTDIGAGELVTESSVQVLGWPTDARPPAAESPERIVGRRAVGAIAAGEALTEDRVVGPSALSGTGGVALALPEQPLAVAGLIRPGDRVDVVGRTDAGPRTLARAASVLTLVDGGFPVVAVPSSAAPAVVAAAATDSVALVLLPD